MTPTERDAILATVRELNLPLRAVEAGAGEVAFCDYDHPEPIYTTGSYDIATGFVAGCVAMRRWQLQN